MANGKAKEFSNLQMELLNIKESLLMAYGMAKEFSNMQMELNVKDGLLMEIIKAKECTYIQIKNYKQYCLLTTSSRMQF